MKATNVICGMQMLGLEGKTATRGASNGDDIQN